MSQNQPAGNVTLGDAPTWNELFENGYPLNREALLLTDVLDYLEIAQPNNVTITFGDIRKCTINGTTGNEQKDKQIKKLSSFVMLKPGYKNDHSYIPPDLRQAIIAPIVLLDLIYKSCFIAIHDLQNSNRGSRMWQYDEDGKREWRVDGLTIGFALEYHPMERVPRNVFFKDSEEIQRITFEEYPIKPGYECTTLLTQTHRSGQTWGNMSKLERAQHAAVHEDILRTVSGEHIHKLPDPGVDIVRTGGIQRMDVIDNQTIPNMQIREGWLEKNVGKRRIKQEENGSGIPGQSHIRQSLEAVTRIERDPGIDTEEATT